MADDPCEAAFAGATPSGPSKYYRARYLDPRLGRFISEDPIGFEDGPNFFAYVGSNPALFVDPWGLKKRIEICQKQRRLTLYDDDESLMTADIVCGCTNTPTPTGNFTGGDWQKDKVNRKFSGPKGWSEDPWSNPYGPWFLPITGSNGCGIHGTRGWEWMGDTFIDMPFTCSHGCVRMSNPNIIKLPRRYRRPAVCRSRSRHRASDGENTAGAFPDPTGSCRGL
jgi:RHS repeat-associated protein